MPRQMLQKLKEDEEAEERPAAELGSLRNTDWVWRRGRVRGPCQGRAGADAMSMSHPQARLWVQLMRELRHGVKLKKVQEKQFNPLPTEYQLTPFEMLMQDIRARNYKLRKVMVSTARLPPRQPPTLPPCCPPALALTLPVTSLPSPRWMETFPPG